MFKRERKSFILFTALSLMLGLSACSETDGDISSASNTINNQSFQKTGTIKGTIFDAITGARIGGTDLRVTLVQGASHRTPNVLVTLPTATDDFVGDFAFTGVPVELDAGNSVHSIVVTNEGYQRFEGNVTLSDSGAQTIPGTTDTTFDFTGNIYLFPLGGPATDVRVRVVMAAQEPVIGAQVLLHQNPAANTPITGTFSRILPSPGFLPALTATTIADANGDAIATFQASTLVFRGSYTATVLPLQHDVTVLDKGISLTTDVAVAGIVVGGRFMPVTITMTDLEPGGDPNGLHVVHASNQEPDKLSLGCPTACGALTLLFSRPVVVVGHLNGENPFSANIVNPDGAVLVGTVVQPVPPVLPPDPNLGSSVVLSGTATLPGGGLSLTLTPQFLFGFDPITQGDIELDIVFSGGLVTLAGDAVAVGVDIFGDIGVLDGISFVDGFVLSDLVHVTGP